MEMVNRSLFTITPFNKANYVQVPCKERYINAVIIEGMGWQISLN